MVGGAHSYYSNYYCAANDACSMHFPMFRSTIATHKHCPISEAPFTRYAGAVGVRELGREPCTLMLWFRAR